MSAAWVLLPAIVMASSLLLVDARHRALRALGLAIFFGGLVGIFATLLVVVRSDEREIAKCTSRGGVPASGECWIDGERQ